MSSGGRNTPGTRSRRRAIRWLTLLALVAPLALWALRAAGWTRPHEDVDSPGAVPAPIPEERRAVEAVEKAGGVVYFEGQREGEPSWKLGAGRPTPRDGKWGRVISVVIFKPTADDDTVVALAALDRLESLSLGRTRITDTGLAHVRKLGRLRLLELGHTSIGDAGLVHLKGFTDLKALGLSATRITDAGLAHLEGLGRLEELHLSGTQIGDAGLCHLEKLGQLRLLTLQGTRVTDAGLARLRSFRNLKHLGISKGRVSERAIDALEEALPQLWVLRQ